MLLYVKTTNFRGTDAQWNFGDPTVGAAPRVQLRGRNSARKTTVREAIAFAFTGRDSQGSAKPVHLITIGEEQCEVEVMTRKGAIIRRTLGRKGAGVLQMALPPGGPLTTLSQADFEAMLCPADVFLSVFVPGYLLGTLPKNRQAAVLSYVLPPVDRRGLVERLHGMPGAMTLDLDYSQRPDLLQKRLADQRNRLSARVSEMRGEERSIKERLALRPACPVEPPEVQLLHAHEQLKKEWVRYEDHMSREEAEAELAKLAWIPLPPPMKAFRERPTEPRPPLFLPDEQRDRCPSCGQTVNLKHRELVRAHNDKIRAAFDVEYASWQKELQQWAEDFKMYQEGKGRYDKSVAEIQMINMKMDQRRVQLEHLLQTKLSMGEGSQPKKPAEEFSAERYSEMKRIVEAYHREIGAYESWHKIAASADVRLAEIDHAVVDALAEIELLRAHESALRQLPDAELSEQKAHLTLPGYELRISDGVELFDENGCPYELLSRGERMHADFQVCLRINALLPRKVGMVFLDDFDLADWSALLNEAPDTVQIYSAHVWAGELSIHLSNRA